MLSARANVTPGGEPSVERGDEAVPQGALRPLELVRHRDERGIVLVPAAHHGDVLSHYVAGPAVCGICDLVPRVRRRTPLRIDNGDLALLRSVILAALASREGT